MKPPIISTIPFVSLAGCLCLALSSCSSSGVRISNAAQQQSLSRGLLSDSIRNDISSREQRENSSCTSFVVRNVSLQSSVTGASGNLMTARELWHLDGCGRSIVYQVDYYGPIHENTPTDVKPIR